MNIVRTGVRLLGVAAFLAAFHGAVAGGVAFAQDAGGLAQQLKDGIDLLQRGRTAEANAKFRAVLAADPSSEDAYQLVQSTSARQILEMLKAQGDAGQVAQRLLNLSQKAEIERSKDEAAISALVAQAVGSRDLMAQETAARQLAAAHGEYAVPALLPHLGSNDIDTRAGAILALRRIGDDAVLPLAASLGTGNETQQRNVANLLGGSGDVRGVPALLRAAKAGGVAGQAAGDAAAKLGWKGDAAAAYLALGEKYLSNDPQVLKNYDKTSVVWSMKDGKLTGTEVLRALYGYELAEQAAYDALACSPGNLDAQAMIALSAYAELAAMGNLTEETKKTEVAQAAMKGLEGVPSLASAIGADGLVRAFTMAAKIKNSDAAMKIAEALPGVWGGRAVGADNPLVMSLSNEDRGIRYAAAIALLRAGPAKDFPAASAVATIAGQAAAERATKQVLVLDGDSKNAMNVQRALNDAGFHAVAYTNASAALSAAKLTGGFDAIVVRNHLIDLSTFQVLDEINRDVRTQNMKKIVMAEGASVGDAEADFAKRSISGVAPTSGDVAGVVNKVKETLASPEGDVGRMKANAVAKAACAALASANGAVFPLKDAEAGLLDAAAQGADEDVRVAALGALANCATPNAQNALRATLAKADNSPALRAGAAIAMGRAVRGQAPAPETFTVLLDAMGDADAVVRNAAGMALGQMKLSAEQQGMVLTKRRT
jgi:CheY-like chemotaxis protein